MRKQVDVVNQSPAGAAEAVLDTVHAVMHLFRSRQMRALREGEHGVTHMEAKALGYFARHPGATQTDLVQHTGRDKGQVARLIAGLRERGLLDAQAGATDRRSVHLEVSTAGRAVQRALQVQARTMSKVAVDGLADDECRVLVALLERVKANLERE